MVSIQDVPDKQLNPGKVLFTSYHSKTLSILLHCTSDLERIADHALNILDSVAELNKRNEVFSSGALKELDIIISAVCDIVDMTVDVFIHNDIDRARYVEPLEEVIDELLNETLENEVEEETEVLAENEKYVDDLLNDYKLDEVLKKITQ